LLRGAKKKKEFNKLGQLLKGLAYLAVHEDFSIKAHYKINN
jgi:hypothetical protein